MTEACACEQLTQGWEHSGRESNPRPFESWVQRSVRSIIMNCIPVFFVYLHTAFTFRRSSSSCFVCWIICLNWDLKLPYAFISCHLPSHYIIFVLLTLIVLIHDLLPLLHSESKKPRHHSLVRNSAKCLPIFTIFFTVRLSSKFAIKSYLKIPPGLSHVATLPCEISM